MAQALERHGFLLLPRFPLLAFAAVSEVLRAGNEILGSNRYEAGLYSPDGSAALASSGERVLVHASLSAAGPLAALWVCAENPPVPGDPLLEALARWGRSIDLNQGLLCGLGMGAAWLAHAGLMHGYRCTVPMWHGAQLAQDCPDCIVSNQIYELDRSRLSAAVGSATLDLAIQWLVQQHGERLLRPLLAQFGLEQLRPAQQRQQATLAAQFSSSSKLAEAVALMENNLSEPLSTEDIAGLVGVSRRQLERLFKQHLDTLPSRWYLEQRLARARRLLQQSSLSVLQIGLSCGFTSGAHFSNAYRNAYGCTPRDERSSRAAAWRSIPLQPGAAREALAHTPPDREKHE